MTTVAEIRVAVSALVEEDFKAFSSWFEAYEAEHWDRQIDRDQKTGPLHDLMERALTDYKAGKCNRL